MNSEIYSKKRKQTTIKSLIITSMIVVLVFVLGTIVVSTVFNLFYKAGIQADEYVGDFIPDTKSLINGTYKGDFKIFDFITATDIEFKIKDGKVISIEFHRMLGSHNISGIPGYGSADKVKASIEKNKSLDFDAVTGASRSSSFTLAAIKNAIENGVIIEE